MKTDTLGKRIHRYLLGDMPEAEQFALEQEFLADGEIFEQVEAVENELIDRYVRGGLTAAEKQLFEGNYLASAVHRERLAFARNLVQAADSGTEREESGFAREPSARWWESLAPARRVSFGWAWVAVVALFAASSVWLYTENRRLREQVSRLSQEETSAQQRTQEFEKELNAQRELERALTAELDRLRGEQSPAVGPETPPDQVARRSIISFVLSPLLMRSSGEPLLLKIPSETEAVVLRMHVQEPDGRSFQVSLRTVDGAQVWQRSGIAARPQQKNGAAVSISIPAGKLPAGDYILTLSAGNEANGLEEINRYFFRVSKP